MPPAKQAEVTDYRVWTSANGKYTNEAMITSYANGVVTLEKRDGTNTKVSQEYGNVLIIAQIERGSPCLVEVLCC